jgi:hypothetical protein
MGVILRQIGRAGLPESRPKTPRTIPSKTSLQVQQNYAALAKIDQYG